MTLREAAERTSRSVTTLRRYIRSGRLRAEKTPGRYGPEYSLVSRDLAEAGLTPAPRTSTPAVPATSPATTADTLALVLRDSVPLGLYQELHMKHEQLLVQYGMVRAGGLRVLELQGEIETRRHQLEDSLAEIARLKEKPGRDVAALRQRLREAELELEGQRLENAALREKVRALEMLTRNGMASGTIERQFSEVVEQIQKVEGLADDAAAPTLPGPWGIGPDAPDH